MDISSDEIVAMINSTRTGSVWEMLDITLVSAEKDCVVATMPIGPHHRQQVGYLHGGISITLAESLASLGTVLNIDAQQADGLWAGNQRQPPAAQTRRDADRRRHAPASRAHHAGVGCAHHRRER